ncbi:MAG: DNA-binding ferritin-like protein (Dps family) [Clostridium sp.]|jgi:DNA-binding ferritin-like protein (Dps family)
MVKTKSLIIQLNKASENLSLENKSIFTDIVVYIRASNIKTRDAEEFLQQILDSFLNAEQQGVSIENMLGTPDIKHYCEEIVNTYKSSYNYLSRCSEYVMYTGMLIIILSIINYITQNLIIIKKYSVTNFTFYLNFNLGVIFQFLFIGSMVIAIMTYTKKSCFKKPIKGGKIKEFFILWVILFLWICILIACIMFLDKIFLFRLNIFIVLLISLILYFTGNYLTEK